MPLMAGTSAGRDLGFRERIGVDTIYANAVPRLQEAFAECGWATEAVTQEVWEAAAPRLHARTRPSPTPA